MEIPDIINYRMLSLVILSMGLGAIMALGGIIQNPVIQVFGFMLMGVGLGVIICMATWQRLKVLEIKEEKKEDAVGTC